MKRSGLCLWLLLHLATCNEDSSVTPTSTTTTRPPSPGCVEWRQPGENDRTIAFGEAHGRLGNQMLMYALMLQLKITLGIDAYISDECMEYMRKVFDPKSILLESLDTKFCNPQDMVWAGYGQHIRGLLTHKELWKGHAFWMFPKSDPKTDFSGYGPEKHTCPEHDKLIKAYHRTMRNTLVFKPEIRKHVKRVFGQVAKKMGRKRKEITYISVHNRRTDHLEYTRKEHKRGPLTAEYFYDAMDAFREDYDNVAFLYISDDMEWGKQNVKDKHKDLFFVGTGNPDSDEDIAIDLALMASCNCSILSRGTYSMWGGILAAGEYHTEYGLIMPDHVLYPNDQAEYILY